MIDFIEKSVLLKDSEEMVTIFRELPDTEKAIALAWIMGAAGKPLETLQKDKPAA